MKEGDEVFTEVFSFFDIRKVKIKRETPKFFVFEIDGQEVRRMKNRFAKTKVELLDRKIEVLNWNLQTLKTSAQEIYTMMKEIDKNYPEILI